MEYAQPYRGASTVNMSQIQNSKDFHFNVPKTEVIQLENKGS